METLQQIGVKGCRGAVADHMNPPVFCNLRGRPGGYGYSAGGFAQDGRDQVTEGAAKTGAPGNPIGADHDGVGTRLSPEAGLLEIEIPLDAAHHLRADLARITQ
jgi:hypothetical protein